MSRDNRLCSTQFPLSVSLVSFVILRVGSKHLDTSVTGNKVLSHDLVGDSELAVLLELDYKLQLEKYAAENTIYCGVSCPGRS